jgi:uncharacterized short protein YbdD (DUF466 family)
MTTGALFASQAKSAFLVITGSKYDNMVRRMQTKNLPALPFTKAQFRTLVLDALGDEYEGAIQCRYCKKYCSLYETAADHAVPLSRGGGIDLSNLEFPCQECNRAKGEMLPEEFDMLLEFLEHDIPFARTSILKRLTEHSKLLAGKRRAEMFARNQGQAPKPKGKPSKPPIISAIDNHF